MLVECGHVRAQAPDGAEWSFTPALARIADLGRPAEIVRLYADLHGPRAAESAAYVLAVLCDQADVTPLVGWHDADGHHMGAMPAAEQILIAQHLMRHGICGKAKPSRGEGKYNSEFDAAEHIALAVAHLGMTPGAAGELSMTELQLTFAAKFPDQTKARDIPSADEYRAFMERMQAVKKD